MTRFAIRHLSSEELAEWKDCNIDFDNCPNCKSEVPDTKIQCKGGAIACCDCSFVVFNSCKDYDAWLDEIEEEEGQLIDQTDEFKEELLTNGTPLKEFPSKYCGRWIKQSGIGVFDIKESSSYQYSSGIENLESLRVETEVGEIFVYDVNESRKPDFPLPSSDIIYYFIFCSKGFITEINDEEDVKPSDTKSIYFAKSSDEFPFLVDITGESYPYQSTSNSWIKTEATALELKLNQQQV